jgi:hypothetical protein
MKLSDFIDRLKLQIPNTNQSGVTDAYYTTLINQACDQVNLITKSYEDSTDFDIEAEKESYQLSVSVPLFLGTSKRGVFFLDADDQWQNITQKTIAWIESVYPQYLNASSAALPNWYYIDGDDIGFYPKPSTASQARITYLKKATPMVAGDHFPFSGSTTELTYLIPLDDAIISYVRWKMSPAFGQVTDVDMRYREFMAECKKGMKQIRRQRNLLSANNGVMRFDS